MIVGASVIFAVIDRAMTQERSAFSNNRVARSRSVYGIGKVRC